jgi:hypothetical protein
MVTVPVSNRTHVIGETIKVMSASAMTMPENSLSLIGNTLLLTGFIHVKKILTLFSV